MILAVCESRAYHHNDKIPGFSRKYSCVGILGLFLVCFFFSKSRDVHKEVSNIKRIIGIITSSTQDEALVASTKLTNPHCSDRL